MPFSYQVTKFTVHGGETIFNTGGKLNKAGNEREKQ